MDDRSVFDLLRFAIEGCTDRFVGRPRSANPYNPACALDAWSAWQLGWDEGDWLLEIRGREEAARWLGEAA